MSELDSEKQVRSGPEPEVPVEDFVLSVFNTGWILCMLKLTHVVALLESVQEQKCVIVGLKYGLKSTGMFIEEVSGAEVYSGWVVLNLVGLVGGAVARKVFLLTEHDNATHHE